MVVDVGETFTIAPFNEPGIHVYVLAPVADKLEDDPRQMICSEADAVTVGVGLTVITLVLDFVQPNEFVAVIVYVVVLAGVTVTDVPLNAPGIHK